MDGIRMGNACRTAPLHVGQESLLQSEVAHGITSPVEVQQSVEADGDFRTDEGAQGGIRLQPATRPDADQLKGAQDRVLPAGPEVDVGKGIQLVEHDVDVVTTDAGRYDRDAFALPRSSNGVELAALDVTFACFKVRCHEGHTSRITHKDDTVCQLLGTYVEVEDGTVGIDDQFGRRKISSHGGVCHYVIYPVKPVRCSADGQCCRASGYRLRCSSSGSSP